MIGSIKNALVWVGELLLLLLALVCTAIEEYGPVAGKYAGRYAARGAAYIARATEGVARVMAHPVTRMWLSTVDYEVRRFIAGQLGDAYPSLRDRVSPYRLSLG